MLPPTLLAILVTYLTILCSVLAAPPLSAEPSSSASASPSSPPSEPSEQPDPDANKYFHEPGGDDLLHHYDIRYFKDVVSDEERRKTLIHLTKAYLAVFDTLGLETWIAHGTLLGWFWNGKVLQQLGGCWS